MQTSSNVTSIDLNSLPGDYPLAKTQASRMLAEALKRADEEKGWSQRTIAKMLHYKTSVVISHMALGRVPIPVDRAMDFARLLKMDPGEFLMAVLEQRHPEIDFRRHLGGALKGGRAAKAVTRSMILDELEAIAGKPLDELPVQQINVLRDVVSDINAPRRWLQVREVPAVELIRRNHPDGLSPAQMKGLQDCINSL